MYRVKQKYRKKQYLIHPLPSGRWVNLLGEDIEIVMPATRARPPHQRKVRGATQEELKRLFVKGLKIIEFNPGPDMESVDDIIGELNQEEE